MKLSLMCRILSGKKIIPDFHLSVFCPTNYHKALILRGVQSTLVFSAGQHCYSLVSNLAFKRHLKLFGQLCSLHYNITLGPWLCKLYSNRISVRDVSNEGCIQLACVQLGLTSQAQKITCLYIARKETLYQPQYWTQALGVQLSHSPGYLLFAFLLTASALPGSLEVTETKFRLNYFLMIFMVNPVVHREVGYIRQRFAPTTRSSVRTA